MPLSGLKQESILKQHKTHPTTGAFFGEKPMKLSYKTTMFGCFTYFSWSPISAGIHTFSFLLAMCVAYFIPKHMHYGYAVNTQLLFWGTVAFLSVGAAVLIWFAHSGGLYGVIIKSLPIAVILTESIVIIFNQFKLYHPIPGAPAQPIQWLLQPKLALSLAAYIAFIIVLLFSLSKRLLERLRIVLFALPLAAMLSILLILFF